MGSLETFTRSGLSLLMLVVQRFVGTYLLIQLQMLPAYGNLQILDVSCDSRVYFDECILMTRGIECTMLHMKYCDHHCICMYYDTEKKVSIATG